MAMLRKTPIKPKRETPRRKGGPMPRIKHGRIENTDHLKRVRNLPCIACSILGCEQVTKTESHHIKRKPDGSLYGASQKAGDLEAIPLCLIHHWNGVFSPMTHREFEAKFGNELDLLSKTLEMLENEVYG